MMVGTIRKPVSYALVFAPLDDAHAAAVKAAAYRFDIGEVVVLDTAHFPSAWRLTQTVELHKTPSLSFEIRLGERRIRGEDVVGIWWRRPKPHIIPNAI